MAFGVHTLGENAHPDKEAVMRKGDRVSFESSDVFLPGPEELLVTAGADGVEGTVIGFSDSGTQPGVFALVEVIRRLEVVVPVDRLTLIGKTLDE